MKALLIALFLFPSIALANDPELDRGPVLPESEKLVKEIESLSCVESMKIRVKPFAECERLKLDLRGIFATIRRDTEAFQEANEKLSASLSSGTDIDRGAQCNLGLILDQTYARISNQHDKLQANTKFAKSIHEGLGKKPWSELTGFRKAFAEASAYANCQAKSDAQSGCQQPQMLQGQDSMIKLRRVLGAGTQDFLPNGAAQVRARKAEAELRALSDKSGKVFALLTKSQQKSQQLKSTIQARRRAIEAKHSCLLEKKELLNKVKAASVGVKLKEKGQSGSGFYVKTKGADGKEHYSFVTAQHVPAADHEDPMNHKLEPAVTAPSAVLDKNNDIFKKAMPSEQIEVEPGRYDRGNDVVSREVAPRTNVLSVVEAGRNPEIGQKFQISGHPVYAGGEFTSHTCSFAGYGANSTELGTAYYMDCPSSITHQGGLSGGSMVDQQGRVWGVAASHAENRKVIRVAPLAADSNGKLVYGAQTTFVSDYCRKPNSQQYYRCQIIPGEPYSID